MPRRLPRRHRRTLPVLVLLAALLGLLSPTVASAAPAAKAAPQTVALPDGFRPEGITSGPGSTFYVGSLADGRIWTGDLRTGQGRVLKAGVEGRALRGMQYDARTGLLWVTGQDGTTGIVLALDARTGTTRYSFQVPGAVFLNDLVVTKRAVWVTDSRVDRLTRLPLFADGTPTLAVRYLPLTGAWPTSPEGNHANGIRVLSDGSIVLDHSTAGGLWQVDPSNGFATQIPVIGGPGITGGDGLVLSGKTLYVVRGSGQQEVSVLTVRKVEGTWVAEWQGALTSPDLDVPSTATLVGKTLWAVNARFGVADPDTAPYQVVPLPTR